MNLQQLRIIRETVRRNYNLTQVANSLYTSQSGVSKHIRDLELEIGFDIFVRKGKRLLGLTEPGTELVAIVERMLIDANNIKLLADHYRTHDQGRLTIAATHNQSRYALPPFIAQFREKFPKVQLVLHQANPNEIVSMLLDGLVDVGISTEALTDCSELEVFPFYQWQHQLVVPKNHPFAARSQVSLRELADVPILTYHEGFTGRSAIDQAFSKVGIVPEIVLTALDADVIKTFVQSGLGVGIIASVAYNHQQDEGLWMVPVPEFESHTARIALRQGQLMREYALDFLRLCLPDIKIDRKLTKKNVF